MPESRLPAPDLTSAAPTATGIFGLKPKSNSSRVVGFFEVGSFDPVTQGVGRSAGDLVFAENLQELRVVELAGAGLGKAGIEGVEHPAQRQLAQGGLKLVIRPLPRPRGHRGD